MVKFLESRFPGTCVRCGGHIPTGVAIEWDSDTRKAWHVECAHLPVAAPAPKPEPSTAPANLSVVPTGVFTVVFDNGERVTLKVARKGANSNLAGKTIVSYLSGPNNDADYTGFAFATDNPDNPLQVWSRFKQSPSLVKWLGAVACIMHDPAKAGSAYALESGRCCRCNRTLTVPESIEAGIGPECASKAW